MAAEPEAEAEPEPVEPEPEAEPEPEPPAAEIEFTVGENEGVNALEIPATETDVEET